MTTIAGWQFKAIAKANIPATDELAMFFGSFNMLAGVAALVLQVLFTGRILRSAGIGVTLFIVPAALTLSSIGLLVVRVAAGGGGAEGQRSGAALLDRQGDRRAAVSAGADRT